MSSTNGSNGSSGNNAHIQMSVETITPAKASQMLGLMIANRPLSAATVKRYAREMLAGRWLLNGESIKVGKSGKVVDGQHRLQAIIMAERAVAMYVARGVDEAAVITLDTGKGRTFHDVNVLAGRSYSAETGPIARWWFRYETGTPTANAVATHQELQDILERHPQIQTSAAFIAKHRILKSRCSGSVQGFVHAYTTEKYDGEMADSFMEDLNDGASLAKSSPIFLLRKRLVDDVRRRVEPSHVLALTIKAWNAWIDADKLQHLVWRNTGAASEEFPRFAVDLPKAKKFRNRAAKVAGAAS